MIAYKDKKEFKILLVEDEFDTVRGTARGIGLKVKTVDNASTIKDAVSFVESTKYDLIIVDVRLPKIPGGEKIAESGLDFIAELHAGKHGSINTKTPFMVLTAQNKSLRLDLLGSNKMCVSVHGKLAHLDVMRKIDELLEKQDKETM